MSDERLPLQNCRVDYAWKWFSYHANQRMQALNYMMVTVGILTTAVATALGKELYTLALAVSLAAAGLVLLFFFLDRRNQTLVDAGRYRLLLLERDYLFSGGPRDGIIIAIQNLSPEQLKNPIQPGTHNIFNHREIIFLFAVLFVFMFGFFFFYSIAHVHDAPAKIESAASMQIGVIFLI